MLPKLQPMRGGRLLRAARKGSPNAQALCQIRSAPGIVATVSPTSARSSAPAGTCRQESSTPENSREEHNRPHNRSQRGLSGRQAPRQSAPLQCAAKGPWQIFLPSREAMLGRNLNPEKTSVRAGGPNLDGKGRRHGVIQGAHSPRQKCCYRWSLS
jgi:hypothetical protein